MVTRHRHQRNARLVEHDYNIKMAKVLLRIFYRMLSSRYLWRFPPPPPYYRTIVVHLDEFREELPGQICKLAVRYQL